MKEEEAEYHVVCLFVFFARIMKKYFSNFGHYDILTVIIQKRIVKGKREGIWEKGSARQGTMRNQYGTSI